jgi:ABC-2 type transport system ATP-binding protein
LEEAEALASRIVVLRGGRVVADGSVAETRDRLGTVRVRVRADAVPELPGLALRERSGDRWTLDCPDGDAFVRALVCSGIPFRSLEVERMGLEEVFLTLTEAEP